MSLKIYKKGVTRDFYGIRVRHWIVALLALVACTSVGFGQGIKPPDDNLGNRNIRRAALIVAVTDYTAFTPLNNPVNDGRAMYKKLLEMGFVVDTLFNPTISELNEYLVFWQREKLEHAQQALFYFAGHGFSIKNENYLVPKTKEFDFTKSTQVDNNCLSVKKVIDLMEEAEVPIQLLILDACRDYSKNVNYDEFGKNPMYSTKNPYVILYSTQHGYQALDGPPNSNSYFAKALIKYLNDSRYNFSAMIDVIVDDVYKSTGGQQKPKSNIIDHFCFSSGTDCSAPASQILAYTESVQRGGSRGLVKPEPIEDTIWNNSKSLIKKGDFYAALDNMTYAMACYQRAVILKNQEGNNKLGSLYLFGIGVQKDVDKAIEYFKTGANFEHPECIRKLGVIYGYPMFGKVDYTQALKYYRLSAEMGSNVAMANIGLLYFEGKGVDQDYEEAFNWLKKSAGLGSRDGMNALGALYLNGLGVSKNIEEAIKWFKKGAELGDNNAMLQLGLMYGNGRGVNKDFTEGLKWIKKSADLGNPIAMIALGQMYVSGAGVSQDNLQALKWFKKSAELGTSLAIPYIEQLYQLKGEAVDYSEIFKYYMKAADLGEASAISKLGVMYENGEGVQQDYAEALKWYKKAAEMGDIDAMNAIGYILIYSQKTFKDYTEGIKWYRKAAELGNSLAINNVGDCYENGFGVKQDYLEAMKWYTKAADMGNETGMFSIGNLFEKGLGVTKDYSESMKWYKKSAEKGESDAMKAIGNLYKEGKGVPKDLAEAEKWYKIAEGKK